MIETLYKIYISVFKDGKAVSQITEYYDNIDECIDAANEIAKEVTIAYEERYNLAKVDLDNTEYKGAYTFATKYIYPFKIHKDYTKIELVGTQKSCTHKDNMKSILREISEG